LREKGPRGKFVFQSQRRNQEKGIQEKRPPIILVEPKRLGKKERERFRARWKKTPAREKIRGTGGGGKEIRPTKGLKKPGKKVRSSASRKNRPFGEKERATEIKEEKEKK